CGGGSGSSEAVQVAVSSTNSCATFRDGTVRCWGSALAQRGGGVTPSYLPGKYRLELRLSEEELRTPNKVVNLKDVVETVVSSQHSCSRLKNGQVRCWGKVPRRRDVVPYPIAEPEVSDAAQIALMDESTCIRHTNGTVSCVGQVEFAGLSGVTDLQARGDLACAIVSPGTVQCWGNSSKGERGDGVSAQQISLPTPTVIKRKPGGQWFLGRTISCHLSSSGQAQCWNSTTSEMVFATSAQDVLQSFAMSDSGSCGVLSNHTLRCWNYAWQPTDKKGMLDSPQQIVVSGDHQCARLASGQVQCWGDSWRGTSEDALRQDGPWLVEGLGKAVDIGSNHDLTCAVVEDGSVRCWQASRQLKTMEGVTDAVQVSMGVKHTCVRQARGTVVCWGFGDRGQLGREGESETWASQPQKPEQVVGVTGAEQIVVGDDTTCVRLTNGAVQCWGDNRRGQLGQGYFSEEGTKSKSATPQFVSLPRPAVDLYGYARTFCAKLTDGNTACWGINVGLVEAKKIPPTQPTAVVGITDALQVAVAPSHACARTKAEKVYCWGSNEKGQMGDGTWGEGNIRAEPVEIALLRGASEIWVSLGATCGRRQDRRVICVGMSQQTPWELPGLVTQAAQIALSYGQSPLFSPPPYPGCAVMNNGSLACWDFGVTQPTQVRW
ncbi:MAG TPA: hypothetical protein PKL73_05210, partial [Polyangiaceae bacterium]|nr:hypothetical protein [Polyangiaceae bacterium]